MSPTFLQSPEEFSEWLEKHHDVASELLLCFYQTKLKKPGLTYKQALDEALCFGWIDGIRKNFDAQSYTIRFTPRKPRSIWSAVNIKRVNELIAEGRMKPGGMKAFQARDEERSRIYSYEQQAASTLEPEYEKEFRANKKAWDYFSAQVPWYRRVATYWVTSAKKEETRRRRLTLLIDESERGVMERRFTLKQL